MKRALIVLSLFLGSAFCGLAQQTVIQKLSITGTAGPSGPIHNTGQVNHQATLISTVTALSWSGSAQFEFSYDNTNWYPFGTPQSSTPLSNPSPGTVVFAFSANGVYPYIRFNLVTSSCADCSVTAWYTGSSAGGSLISTQGAVASGSNTTSVFPTLMGIEGGADNLFPARTCDLTQGIYSQPVSTTVTAGTTGQLTTGSTVHTTTLVCSFIVTLSAAGTVQFLYGQGSTCGTNGGTLTPAFNLAAGAPLISPPVFGGGVLIDASIFTPSNICLAATGGNAQVYLTYAEF